MLRTNFGKTARLRVAQIYHACSQALPGKKQNTPNSAAILAS